MKEFNDWFKSQYGTSDILIQGMVKEIAKESWIAANGGKKDEKYKYLVYRVIEILEEGNNKMSFDNITQSIKNAVNNIEGMKP